MNRFQLTRYYYGNDCTLGFLALERSAEPALLYTIEDAWKENRPRESCIPDGLYLCRPRQYFAGGYLAIEVSGVPGRSTILIHRGNTAEDVTGCIVVGQRLGVLAGKLAVLNSAQAWVRLMSELGSRVFELDISPQPPLAGATLGEA